MAEIAAENKGNMIKNIRLAGSILSIILGIWVALQTPPEGLNEKTMRIAKKFGRATYTRFA